MIVEAVQYSCCSACPQVMNGMSASAAELQKYLSYWDKYKYIWENDKVIVYKEILKVTAKET